MKALTEELEAYRLRLAGALIASEGGNGQPDGALEAIRTCPTITSVMQLRKQRDAQAEAVRDIIAAIKGEPELPGPMPDEMWAMLNGNRDVTQLALVRAVQATKEGILKTAKRNSIARAAVEGGSK